MSCTNITHERQVVMPLQSRSTEQGTPPLLENPADNVRFRKLDLNLLVALDALLTEVNVTRAAKRMHITQSAMSAALGRIRDHFGDPILVPSGRGMQRTRLGDELVAPLSDLVARIDALVSSSRVFDAARSDESFCIGLASMPSTALMARMVQLGSEQAPGVSFSVRQFDQSADELLQDAGIDLICVPENLRSPDMPYQRIVAEPWMCLAEGVAGPITLEAFGKARHIAFPGNASPLKAELAKVCADAGHPLRIELSTTQAQLAADWVAPGRLVLMPQSVAKAVLAHNPRLKAVALAFDVPEYRLVMQWRDYDQMDPAVIWLRDLMRLAASAA
jgi:LysR family transcriptional regulator, nod-box dependent transcriptional activator